MKPFLTTASIFLTTLIAAAQEPADTIATQQLQEIVIAAPKVIRKADMDVYHPSESAVINSKNGMQLLRNLMIPTLSVNDALGSITSGGQSVQVRINGREATIEQVQQLLPETIKRVEWIDNPGLRYNGATGVINFIVSNPAAGGSLMAYANPALNSAWGMYRTAVKINHGRSQWGASVNYKLANHLSSYREFSESFSMPGGEKIERSETPDGGYLSSTFGSIQLDYSYIKPDTTVFWVAVHGYKQWPETSLYRSIMSQTSGLSNVLIRDFDSQSGFTPSFTAYLEQHLPHRQLIAVDFSGSFYNGNTQRTYTEEEDAGQGAVIADVNTAIKDRNQAYGIEADYIKNWSQSRFTAGINYKANRNRSTYENLGNEIFHQRQDRLYFFGEYFQRINKVTLTAGLGAQYTSFKFKETNQGTDSWNLRPQFTFTYRPNQTHQLRLNFTSWQTAPSLAETNVVPQQIDAFQWSQGNPDLHTSQSYMLTLRYSYDIKRISGSFGVRAFSSPDAIAPYTFWSNDRLITSHENSDGLQNLSFWLAPSIEVIPGWMWIEGMVQYRAERMKGTGYTRYNHDWSGQGGVILQHWGWQLVVMYQRAQRDLWGQKLSWGEDLSLINLEYNWKNWQFGAALICPFTKYDQGARSYDTYHTYEKHIRMNGYPMPCISVSYNIQWGRQRRDARKIVNADGEVTKSSAARR